MAEQFLNEQFAQNNGIEIGSLAMSLQLQSFLAPYNIQTLQELYSMRDTIFGAKECFPPIKNEIMTLFIENKIIDQPILLRVEKEPNKRRRVPPKRS